MAKSKVAKKKPSSFDRKSTKKKKKPKQQGVKGLTRTIETMRLPDETIGCRHDEEVLEEDKSDEFADYFSGKSTPKIMVTTNLSPSGEMISFLKEVLAVFPNTFYYKRKGFSLKTICKAAAKHDFTDLMVFAENRKMVNGLYLCHLPHGPTSYFRITGVKLAQDMKGGAYSTTHLPEIILKNFDTRLGHRVERQLASLFPQNPEFYGRRVMCLHNQRDFIFFRHHRYVFDDNGKKCRLKEIGPRFTLKLYWMQEGCFDIQTGQFEFVWRPDMQVNRKAMFI